MARVGYPIIIGIIGFLVVLRYALLDFTLGLGDTEGEFMVYSLIVDTGKWQIVGNQALLSSCLFTTYLPAMFQRAFNTDIMMTYKLFPCFIMPILPVAVYYLTKKWLAPHYAFLASVFIVIQIYFLWGIAFSRILVAVSFFALGLLVIFSGRQWFKVKVGLLVVLSSCLVTAHYGTTFVVFFAVSIACMLLRALQEIKGFAYPHLKPLLVFLVVLTVVGVPWLGVINRIPLGSAERMVRDSVTLKIHGETHSSIDEDPTSGANRVYNFFKLGTREEVVQVAFGKTLPYMNTPQRIEFVLSWLTILLMSLGLALMIKREGFKNELVALMCVCYFIIVISVIFPPISVRYGIARVYFSMVVVLAPCFIVGGLCVADKLKCPRLLVILAVLIPYGLCTSGIMHSFFGIVR